jgi:hypothetical protein
MNLFFKKIQKIEVENEIITIVSGLPRSGTSMMMQILIAGGMKVVTDHIREADDDNPRGYFELEKVKKIKEDCSWLKDCNGKAFKMVSPLLEYLPNNLTYKIIFMKRKMEELLASQKQMLNRLGQVEEDISDEKMASRFKDHLKKVEDWLQEQNNMDVVYMDYNDVIKYPEKNVRIINRFLNNKLIYDKMVNVIDKSLYRQRRKY